MSGVLCVCLRVRVGGGWLGARMWHARGEERRRAADGSVALRAAAAAWAARVVAHPPLRRFIQWNDALTSLPAGLFHSSFTVGGHMCVGGDARKRRDGGAWE